MQAALLESASGAQRPSAPHDEPNIDISGLAFLVLDDQPRARTTLRTLLSQIGGNRVTLCSSVEDVMVQLDETGRKFDVIVSDYQLGGLRDGQQLLEEVRLRKLIPRSTVFMMVTGENSYRNIVSTAELLPDDYLIKPFTAEVMRSRLLKAIERKQVLSPVLRLMDQEKYDDAVHKAKTLRPSASRYSLDLIRLELESLLEAGRHEAVVESADSLLARRKLPWAMLLKARALVAMARMEDADKVVDELSLLAPDFIAALDLQASILEAAGRTQDAQRVLELALHKSPRAIGRRRAHGRVALNNGDAVAAEKSLNAVIQQGHGTSLIRADDYVHCAMAAIQNHHPERALHTMERAAESLGETPEVKAHAALVQVAALGEKARPELVNAALQNLRQNLPDTPISPDLKLEMMRQALRHGDANLGKEIGTQLAFQNQGDEHALQAVRKVFATHNMAQEGDALIDDARRETVELNNRAIGLARDNQLEASVKLLVDAAHRSYAPPLVVLNAISAILSLHQRGGGATPEQLTVALSLFARAETVVPDHPKMPRLRASLAALEML